MVNLWLGAVPLYRLIGISTELLLIMWFMYPHKPAAKRAVWIPIFLLVFLLITTPEQLPSAYARVGMVLARLVIVMAFFRAIYALRTARSVVLGMIYTLLTLPIRWMITACLLFVSHTPLATTPVIQALAPPGALQSLLFLVAQILCLWGCRHAAPPMAIECEHRINHLMCPLLMLCYLYLRYDLKYWGFQPESRPFELVMILLAYCFIIVVTILTQRIFILQRQRMEQENQLRLNEIQYQHIQSDMQWGDDLKKIYHDMRHHLSAIDHLAQSNPGGMAVHTYIQSLQQSLPPAVTRVKTGHDLLDALISSRLQQATASGIPMSVAVDFTDQHLMTPIDMCTLFCNLVDNAIDASQAAQAIDRRRITLKAGWRHGVFLIKCANYYDHALRQDGTRFMTTKSERAHHGYGLSSVMQVVRRCGGTANITAANHLFTVQILIPQPDTPTPPSKRDGDPRP